MKYILIVVAALALIVGLYLNNRSKNTPNTVSDTAQEQTTNNESTSNKEAQSATETQQVGAYVDYKDGLIASTSGTKILFFHAPWCPQCRALDGSIKAGEIPAGVTIMKVDYDTNQSLRQKYGVTIQTTLVRVDDAGNLVEKYVAYESPTLAAVKENLL